jgi:hypothetical protein
MNISEISRGIVEISIGFSGEQQKVDMNSPEGVKTLVDSFFSILQEVTSQLRLLQQQHEEKICETEQLKEDFRN